MSRRHYFVQQCAIVVLAAGTSRRLGSPKQLLVYRGKSLLQYSVETALQTGIRPVVIVTGANSEIMEKQIEGIDAHMAVNKQWQEGIASSIRCGIITLREVAPDTDGIIFMVCDQPHVSKSLLDSLLSVQHKTGLPLVASSYGNTTGTPALFHQSLFDALIELTGDSGAKKLIRQHEELAGIVAFPKGDIDIDTMTDYEMLLQ